MPSYEYSHHNSYALFQSNVLAEPLSTSNTLFGIPRFATLDHNLNRRCRHPSELNSESLVSEPNTPCYSPSLFTQALLTLQ